MKPKIYLKKSKEELIDELIEKDKVLEEKDKVLEEKDKVLEEKDKALEDLKRVKEKLEKELRKYKNANTPSSANKHLMPETQGLKARKGAKRGAPKGHKGTTRQQIPIRTEIVDTDICPKCKSNKLKDRRIRKRIVEETLEPSIPEPVEVQIHEKECLGCGHIFIPEHSTTPLKGKFGINIMIMVIMMKFLLRGVLRKTSDFLNSGFAFKITPASVNAIIKRVADAAEKEYDNLKKRIRTSEIAYVDETSFSVLGKKQWVWVFRTAKDILLVIRPSRGSNVLEEILGADYSGTVVCDCWRAYNFLSQAKIQRCWAHLLRKSKELCDSLAGHNFHTKLKAIFGEIKEFNETNPDTKQRLIKYQDMTARLKKIVYYYAQYEELNSVANYVIFNLENWLTCVKYQGIEPTNNFAERAIRETVMVRKIIGAFRSETGKENYETLASLISTWQLNQLDLKAQLKQMLTKNLCFC